MKCHIKSVELMIVILVNEFPMNLISILLYMYNFVWSGLEYSLKNRYRW